jgi:hypothetical protein
MTLTLLPAGQGRLASESIAFAELSEPSVARRIFIPGEEE